ncbi:MAG: Phosphoribosyltransferase [Candidatus Levybacteria bacterium GW2011_GWB1_35_5]|nr:MAG: Phosphoribosyltransferase [Candidatus Levybacteria bacterium GW2011_GWB1_35_5]
MAMFKDRIDAALKICQKLKFLNTKNYIVVGLTRGGVVTAKALSKCLKLSLKALIVKKIGAPNSPELAIGAIAYPRHAFWNKDLCKKLGINSSLKKILQEQKLKEIKILKKEMGIKIKRNEFNGKNVILVDDGIATGMSVLAALKSLKKKGAKRVILAVPVIAIDTLNYIKKYFDRIIYLRKERDFYAVSEFYEDFPQVESKEVSKLLAGSL